MNFVKYIIGAFVAVGGLANAETLDKSQISHDAKWLVHLDVDSIKESFIGGRILNIALTEMEKGNEGSIQFDLEALLDEVYSVTAYGTSFDQKPEDNSVLILRSSERFRSIVDAFILSSGWLEDEDGAKEIQGAPYPTYLFGDEVHVSFPTEDLALASKSLAQIEKAMGVINGEMESMDDTDSDLTLSKENGFFFIATANGINDIDNIPPQARVLQKATGGQLSLGEEDEIFVSNITLSTTGPTVSDQLYRIIQGMIALASFTEIGNESLALLTRNISVTKGQDFVSVDLRYPSAEIEKLMVNMAKEGGNLQARQKPKIDYDQAVEDGIGGEEIGVVNIDAKADNGNLPRNATDSDPESFWGSRARTWIRLELESPSLVREVQIAWKNGLEGRHRFIVQTSQDGAKWINVIHRRAAGGSNQLESYNIPDTPTSWIRILCEGKGGDRRNIQISDLRIIGQKDYVAPEPEPESSAG